MCAHAIVCMSPVANKDWMWNCRYFTTTCMTHLINHLVFKCQWVASLRSSILYGTHKTYFALILLMSPAGIGGTPLGEEMKHNLLCMHIHIHKYILTNLS